MKTMVKNSMAVMLTVIMAFTMLVGFGLPVHASTLSEGDSFTEDGFTYNVIKQEDGSLALNLSGCTKNVETIIIPESVNELPVVSIDGEGNNYVFQETILTNTKKICIPDSVTYIDRNLSTIFVADGTEENNWMATSVTFHCGENCPWREMVVDYDDIYVFESHTYDGKGICTVCGSVAKNNKPADNPSNVTKDEPKNTLEKTPVVSDVKVSSINVTGFSKKVAAGKKIKLTADISPANASNKAVKWTSSNTKVATVDQKGTVTVKKNTGGKTVVITATATDGSGVKATYKIKSMKGVVKKVTISGPKIVKAGKSIKLKAKVTGTANANKKVQWVSNNEKYATVTSSGKVIAAKTAKGKTVKITAMSTDGSGKKKTVKIKIK